MQQSTKNKIMMYGFVAAILAAFFIPGLETWSRFVIALLVCLLFIFLRRAYIFFVWGAKKLEKKDPKCWNLFKKAVEAHLPYSQQVYLCTAFIKQGDAAYGIKLAEDIIAHSPGTPEAKTATVTLSMGYWVKGELDRAIALLEDLKATGFEDKTMDINLSTYLLEKGQIEKARQIIDDCESKETLSHGMMDNKLWAFILSGEYEKAIPLVSELMEERKPKFPEAYLHSAQVMVHQGRITKAVEYIEDAIEQHFSLNGTMGQDYLKKLSDGLQDSRNRLAYAYAMDQNAALVASGKDFDIDLEKGADFTEVTEEQVREESKAARETQPLKAGEPQKHVIIDDLDDDREPNTELTDDDAEFGFDDDEDSGTADSGSDEIQISDDDEKAPNTEISEDDEREPNTDLD